MVERAKGIIEVQATGLGTLSQMSNLVTGMNQGLELAGRLMGTVTEQTKRFVATGSQFEQFTVQFETLLGSVDAADARIRSLFQFATSTPFELPDVVNAAKSLEAYGLFSERTLRAAGDAAAAFGKDFNETTLAIAGAATNEMERLKQFGITTATITEHLGHEMVRNTTEGLEEITQAVVELFEEKAGGGMMRLTNTMEGRISNLADSWTRFQKLVMDAGPFETVNDILGSVLITVNKLFDQGAAERAAEVVGDALADALWDASIAMATAADTLIEIAEKLDVVRKGASAAAPLAIDPFGTAITAAQRATGIGLPIPTSPLQMFRMMSAGLEGGSASDSFGTGLSAQLRQQRVASQLYTVGSPWAASDFAARGGGGGGAQSAGGAGAQGGGWWGPQQGWMNTPAMGYGDMDRGVRGSGEMPGMESPDEKVEERVESERAYLEAVEEIQGDVLDKWDTYYSKVGKLGAKWAKQEKINLKDIQTALGQGAREQLAAFADVYLEKAKTRAAFEAAEALAAVARYDFASAAKHAAAAAGFMALNVAGSIATSYMVEKGYSGGAGGGGGGSSDVAESSGGNATGTRTVSRTVGVTAQNITNNLYITHNAPVAYGPGGWQQVIEEEIVPALEEMYELARVG